MSETRRRTAPGAGRTTPVPVRANDSSPRSASATAPLARSMPELTSRDYQHALPPPAMVRGWDMHFTTTVVVWAALGAAVWYGCRVWQSLDGEAQAAALQQIGLSSGTAAILASVLVCLTGCCFGGRPRGRYHIKPRPRTQQQYTSVGLGPTQAMSAEELYMDMMKRTIVNVIYQDKPQWLFDQRKQAFLADGFDLEYRVRGEDMPVVAHSMVGLRRLSNVQDLMTDVIKRGVPGDVIETGVYRGGTTVFMKAVLRAFKQEHRRVWVCDTFQPGAPPATMFDTIISLPIIRLISSFPGAWWRRKVFDLVQHVALSNNVSSFPSADNPSHSAVDVIMFVLRNAGSYAHGGGTSMDEVAETFARYGLLDDNVKFLKGFFSDTLPGAGIEQLSVIRLDGDTYESTITALEPLYPKLAPGGYVIVDDYNSFSDCQTAIDEYRTKHNITAPLVPIDNLSVYWKKE